MPHTGQVAGLLALCAEAGHWIETAAGLTIPDIFEVYGEAAFRDCEKRVIARLLQGPVHQFLPG